MVWSCEPMQRCLFSCSSGDIASITSCELPAHLRLDITMSARVVAMSWNRPALLCHNHLLSYVTTCSLMSCSLMSQPPRSSTTKNEFRNENLQWTDAACFGVSRCAPMACYKLEETPYMTCVIRYFFIGCFWLQGQNICWKLRSFSFSSIWRYIFAISPDKAMPWKRNWISISKRSRCCFGPTRRQSDFFRSLFLLMRWTLICIL